ncbi:ankyrin repeat domain-containing protein [Bordetella tumbae]|uniref:ankyrin repeat domain-containing protein n=1 Tax=Bordetella tumbae TaxID=1649139 RepID=UPI0039F13BC5
MVDVDLPSGGRFNLTFGRPCSGVSCFFHLISASYFMRIDPNRPVSETSATGLHNVSGESAGKIPNDDFFSAVTKGSNEEVAGMFARGRVDLAAINDAHGQTPLHMAIAMGHNEIAKTILAHCGDNPQVLDAPDRQGYTPLMRAAALKNVDLMQALVKAGASQPNSQKVKDNLSSTEKQAIKMSAVLIEAKGDLNAALEIAVKEGMNGIAELFADNGADPASLLQRVAEQASTGDKHDRVLASRTTNAVLLLRNILRQDKFSSEGAFEAVLDNLVRSGDVRALSTVLMENDDATSLFKHYAQSNELKEATSLFKAGAIADDALWDLAEDATLTASEKKMSLGVLITAEKNVKAEADGAGHVTPSHSAARIAGLADTAMERAVSEMYEQGKQDEAKLLVKAGAPAVALLMHLCQKGDMRAAKSLINLGADFITTMNLLMEQRRQSDADVLAVALSAARDEKIAARN